MTRRVVLVSLGLLVGCGPTADDLLSAGGQAPHARASLLGTLTYSGPAPTCDADGQVKGLALLSLFLRSNPPPPEGAGLPVSLLLIPGEALFRSPEDCRRPGDTRVLARSASFTWPGVPLDPPSGSGPATYRILGVWDDDRNLNPLYLVRASPTFGDLAGGALEGPLTAPVLADVQVGPTSAYPAGQVLNGVAVTVAAPVSTELPVAHLTAGTQALTSEATFPLAFERAGMEAGLLAQTDVGLALPDLSGVRYAKALAAAGLGTLTTDPVARAWYVQPLDLDADGVPDPHPVLGALAGVPRLAPVVAFQRARTPAEVAVGIPTVTLLANPVASQEVLHGDLPLVVPPLAVLQLGADPACAVPYAAPGNITLLYEGARAVCTELPTGRYSVNVVHGLAGAAPVPTSTAASATGVTLAGGQPSGQFWIIPNELGPPDTRYDPAARDQLNPPGSTETLTLDEQGDGGRFLVTDLEPSDDLPSARPTCQQALDPLAGTVRPIQFAPVAATCCAAVRPLCGLPLCPARDLGEGRGSVRELDRLGEDGKATCVPFELPPGCCR